MASKVHGVGLDAQTRCAHWRSPSDVLALKAPCCGRFYACHSCHAELENHEWQPWPAATPGSEHALFCGVCQSSFSLEDYLGASCPACPACAAAFNPGCKNHWELYFNQSLVSKYSVNATCRAPTPRLFDSSDHKGILNFFKQAGYCAVANAISPQEVSQLNALCEKSQARWPERWDQISAMAPGSGPITAARHAQLNPVLRQEDKLP
eukprot:SAG31_NODE_3824_length_3849_cov_2.006400_2_plen_208_part_00